MLWGSCLKDVWWLSDMQWATSNRALFIKWRAGGELASALSLSGKSIAPAFFPVAVGIIYWVHRR